MTPPGDGGPDLLKPCPCCGKDEAILCDATGDHFVHCAFCGLRTARFSTDECAVLHWNERPEPRPSTRDAALQTETDRWEKQARMMAIVADRHKAHAALLDAILLTLRPTAENVGRIYEKVKDTQSQVWRLLRVIDGEIRDHLGLEREEDT